MSVSVILSNLLLSESFSRKVIPHLQSEFFQIESDRVVFDIIKDFFHLYNKIPDLTAIKVELANHSKINEHTKKECNSLISEFTSEQSDEKWLIDLTEKFCQEKSIENALYQSIEILQNKTDKNKLDKGSIPKLLSDALAISFDAHVGHDLLGDWVKRYDFYHRNEERIPFDIDYLNKITNGGLPRKTLNILMAGTGVGKSLVMCHMAAANLLIGKNVLYITLEMAEERIAERIDANLLDTPIGQLALLPKAIYEKKIEKLKEKVPGKLIIKEYPTASAGADNFRYLLNELKLKKKFKPDIIYIDYLGICKSSRIKYSSNVNTYLFMKMIAEEIRGLAVEFDLPVVTAIQTNRGGFVDSDPGLEHSADSFGIPFTADLQLVIMSNEELAQLNQLAFKQVKNRYNDPNIYTRFHVGCDRSKMRLLNLEKSAEPTTPLPSPTVKHEAIPDTPVFDKALNRKKFEGFK